MGVVTKGLRPDSSETGNHEYPSLDESSSAWLVWACAAMMIQSAPQTRKRQPESTTNYNGLIFLKLMRMMGLVVLTFRYPRYFRSGFGCNVVRNFRGKLFHDEFLK